MGLRRDQRYTSENESGDERKGAGESGERMIRTVQATKSSQRKSAGRRDDSSILL